MRRVDLFEWYRLLIVSSLGCISIRSIPPESLFLERFSEIDLIRIDPTTLHLSIIDPELGFDVLAFYCG